MATRDLKALEFRIGEAFPPDDVHAQYVMRLSMALGDLCISLNYAVRAEQPDHERIYFVRLTGQHLRELAVIFLRPDATVIPSIEDFIAAAIPVDRADWQHALRDQHQKVLDALDAVLQLRPVTLGDELKRLRNGFAHYHRDRESTAALAGAMNDVRDLRSRYSVTPGDQRADYADEVTARLMHPFPKEHELDMALDMHQAIVDFVGIVADYVRSVEAYYLRGRPVNVVRDIWTERP